MIIRGDSGDHNGAAHTYQYIKSTDTYAVEIDHTDMLSGVVERLKRAGVDSNTFNTIVLFGHGSEECFSMSLSEEIPPSPRKWYNKKGMRCLIEALGIDTIVLSSCHPLVQEEGKYEPFTLIYVAIVQAAHNRTINRFHCPAMISKQLQNATPSQKKKSIVNNIASIAWRIIA